VLDPHAHDKRDGIPARSKRACSQHGSVRNPPRTGGMTGNSLTSKLPSAVPTHYRCTASNGFGFQRHAAEFSLYKLLKSLQNITQFM